MPDLIISSNNINPNCLLLEGYFGYYLKGYRVQKKILRKDSSYIYPSYKDKGGFLFDFSTKKKTGELRINDSINLKTVFFMDVVSNNQNFRLFMVSNIDKYYTVNLSRIYITNYNYGILGELIVGKENNQWFVFDTKGYIPNKKYIHSIFERATLQ